MSVPTLFGLCAAALVGLGLYGVLTNPQPLRKLLAFNLIGNGVFLLFGAIARRGAAAGFGGDPVPQGLLITGIVVAFSATALAIALVLRLFDESGSTTLAADQPASAEADDRDPYQSAEKLGVLRQAQDERKQL
jgi:multicomponent Na+:H+ antiporter subunit C